MPVVSMRLSNASPGGRPNLKSEKISDCSQHGYVYSKLPVGLVSTFIEVGDAELFITSFDLDEAFEGWP